MAPITRLDIDGLHRLLWRRANHRKILKIKAAELAEELNMTQPNASTVLKELVDTGRAIRLTRLGGRGTPQFAQLRVVDPDEWTQKNGRSS